MKFLTTPLLYLVLMVSQRPSRKVRGSAGCEYLMRPARWSLKFMWKLLHLVITAENVFSSVMLVTLKLRALWVSTTLHQVDRST